VSGVAADASQNRRAHRAAAAPATEVEIGAGGSLLVVADAPAPKGSAYLSAAASGWTLASVRLVKPTSRRQKDGGDHMRAKLATTLIVVGVLLAHPAVVAATAYSSLVAKANWYPPGYGQSTLCDQSGIVDTARNYNQAVSKYYTNGTCGPTNITLPSGYLGTQVSGYRGGVFCGVSSIYYSTVATSAWQLWITLCSNPSGLQAFYSVGWPFGFNGSGYTSGGGTTSPSQNY
jgi:hypothetical protein